MMPAGNLRDSGPNAATLAKAALLVNTNEKAPDKVFL
jgi:hypothetical protein